MRRLSWDSSFRRAFKRLTRRDRILQERIFDVLDQLARDPFLPALKTHKLSGQLQGLWACWVSTIAASSLLSKQSRKQAKN